MRFRRALVLSLGLALTAPLTARAQTPGQEVARRAFEEGVALEKGGDYEGALARFREAAKIRATAGVRFHEAYCLEMTGKLATALDTYEAAEKLAKEQGKPDVEAAVRTRLGPLRARVPQLTVRVHPQVAGAEVLLDGAPLAAPLLDGRAFRVDPGEHVVIAKAPEHRTVAAKVRVGEGKTVPVDLTLEPESASAPAAAAGPVEPAPAASAPAAPPPSPAPAPEVDGPPPEPPPSRSLALPIATTAGAVVALAGGVVAFVLAGSAKSDAEATCPTKPSCDDERSEIRTLDAVALGGFLGAAGLGALSVVLWTKSAPSSTGALPARAARVRATPRALVLEGTF